MSAITPELIEKYSVSGPRYTSYPTAVEFKSTLTSSIWEKLLRASADNCRALSMYVHIPFCQSLCYFCACHKVITDNHSASQPFLDAIGRELAAYRRLFSNTIPVTQLHWGGGSPNFLSDDDTERLFSLLHEAFPLFDSQAEISYEADPRTMTRARISLLRRLGFNRISFGVQDFDPIVQKLINRIQPVTMVQEICFAAREEGFNSINVDLIYGLPAQTEKGFCQTIEQVLRVRPDRVALYGYAHVPWLKKVQKKFERVGLPSPHIRTMLLWRAIEMFESAGYRYIGMDHFALPDDDLVRAQEHGTLARNFMGYTVQRAEHLIALGPSSISSIPECFAQNVKDLDVYLERTRTHGLAVERGIERSLEDRMRACIISEILCLGKIDVARIEERWGINFEKTFAPAISELGDFERRGLLFWDGAKYQLSALGRFFMRNVAMLFDAYLPKYQAQEKPAFSQAV